ncbi:MULTISPECIES: nickel ABC transporter ATP-binding protein NikE [Saccharibacillus]|uniref:nickel ABC transporter ATP-binding protein NikE n=1 Tax=Saccharibacillus TaxID=456492 RepID=UPI00123BF98B|nr:ABC transporter ATP-binding protein [Saccharibacillus sp. WB 17]MWJ32175.1 nickel ABC transporter ATP-binding protein NikE [Saccharibacillus sp. WB 17]
MEIADKQEKLRIDNLEISYRSEKSVQTVLQAISFTLYEGEIVSLLGESGSGKSTIAKTLLGLLPPSASVASGTLVLEGHAAVCLARPERAWAKLRGRGIAMLFQDARLALNPMMAIGEHFRETLRAHRLAEKEEISAIGADWLSRLGFADPAKVLRSYPHELSGGMCQRVCLALALCLRPQVLIADEPTSALDTVNQREVLDLLHSLQRELDLTVLLITHDLALAQALSHRVLVLHEGRIVERGETAEVLARPQHAYTRQLLDARTPTAQPEADGSGAPAYGETPLLDVHDLAKSYGSGQRVLSGVRLRLHEREIVGILGQSGCGKSTLVRCIVGLDSADAGTVRLRGEDITHATGQARRRLARHVQLVFQDARASLNPRVSALELVQTSLHVFRVGSRAERLERARFLLDAVGIPESAQRRRPPQLSTGQCQRIAIARALALQPEILICDEAVSALDMSVQAQILELLQRLHRQFGFSILMISHDVKVLRAFCHQIAVMHEGRFIEQLPGRRLLPGEHEHTRLLLRGADFPAEEERPISADGK